MEIKPNQWTEQGFCYQDFFVQRIVPIPELQCPLIEIVHEPTGASILYVPSEDPENFFCLSFQTLPPSSNGIAHILEHTVLCGSKKFPVKDPFFSMHRRSLNTFMNAFTGADFTCYPAASQVQKDFYNLLEVYLDAVFRPTLSKMSFRQEGHRLEFASPKDPTTPLERKGIVFNEMKGALNSAEARLHQAMDEALFPSSPYGYNYGGDPKEIPHLTYSELVEFHQKYYHPSRCLFFFYGNIPLEKHLDFLKKHVFQDCAVAPSVSPPPPVVRLKQKIVREGFYPYESEAEEQTYVSLGWLTCSVQNQEEVLALNILDIVLMDNDASPLKRALQSSALCKQAVSHLEDDKSEVPWVFTLKGCPPDMSDEIESMFFQSLEQIMQQGISLTAIENAMHQLEFHRSEITGDHYPFGLTLFMRSGLLKQHGVAPENGLTLHTHFAHLREKLLQEPNYFINLIKRYIMENSHAVRITLRPSKALGKEENEVEEAILRKLREELADLEVQNVVEQAERLKEYRKRMEDADQNVLPKIHLEDIPKQAREYVLYREAKEHWTFFSHNTFTNGIVYADVHLPLPLISVEDIPYLSLFSHLLTQLGSGGNRYVQTLEKMQAHTGGFGSCLSFFLHVADQHSYIPQMVIRGKSLERELPKLFQLFNDLFIAIDRTDTDRFYELLQKHATALESSVNQAAMRYAKILSASGLNTISWLQNQFSGLPYYQLLRRIKSNLPGEIPQLVARFSRFYEQIFQQPKPHLVITCQDKPLKELLQNNFFGLFSHAKQKTAAWSTEGYPVHRIQPQGRVVASAVAFSAQSLETVPYVHPHAPLLAIASSLFDNLVLHVRIREQGGAYGGGSSCHSLGGTFGFYSYRDPQIASSLQAYREAVLRVEKGEFDEENLEEAKLEVIQALDTPISPGSRGALAYQWELQGKTLEVRQQFRDRVLAASKKQVREAVAEQIASKLSQASPVVFASKALLEEENEKMDVPLKIYSIESEDKTDV